MRCRDSRALPVPLHAEAPSVPSAGARRLSRDDLRRLRRSAVHACATPRAGRPRRRSAEARGPAGGAGTTRGTRPEAGGGPAGCVALTAVRRVASSIAAPALVIPATRPRRGEGYEPGAAAVVDGRADGL